MSLKVGDEAPDFELRSHRGGTVRLSNFRGKKNVVVAFHPLAFTPVCATQMSVYQSQLPAFDAADTAVLGVSVDAQPAKQAWAGLLGKIDFDLLSDFHPHGDVARQYGVLREKDGISERALFLVDRQGRIAWTKTYEIPDQPPLQDLMSAVNALKPAEGRGEVGG
jgi:peroxiredoxin (alkyl hydroperoxide reductase subunit C)